MLPPTVLTNTALQFKADLQRTNDLPYENKNLLTEKRRATSIWQRTHAPDSRSKCNRKSNKLKSKLQEMRNESFEIYVPNLKMEDNSIWKRIKNKRNPKTALPTPNSQIFNNSGNMGKK
jgi:hypothetical protein